MLHNKNTASEIKTERKKGSEGGRGQGRESIAPFFSHFIYIKNVMGAIFETQGLDIRKKRPNNRRCRLVLAPPGQRFFQPLALGGSILASFLCRVLPLQREGFTFAPTTARVGGAASGAQSRESTALRFRLRTPCTNECHRKVQLKALQLT